MNPISAEEYKKMLQEDMDWAQRLVDAVRKDKRPFVRYKQSRPVTSLKQMLQSSVQLFPDNIAFYTKFEKGPYQTITYTQFQNDVNALGTALLARGFHDQRIAVIGETNYTWSVADMAVLCGTGVAVPLDRELPYADLRNLIKESEASCVIFDKKREAFFTQMMAEGETGLRMLVSQNEREDKDVDINGVSVHVFSMWKLMEEGRSLINGGDCSYIDAQIDSRAMSVILFTSGTTGMAKGIMLSHRNFCAELMVAPTVLEVRSTDIFFSLLPIHHTYEFTCDFLVPLYKGAAIAHCEGLRYITKNLAEVQPTMFLGVPAVFESLHKQVWKSIRAKGKEEQVKKAIRMSLFARNKLHMDISDLFCKEIKASFGGKLRLIIAGGAAINPEILDEFRAYGIQALQGYGLSECAPMGALNPDTAPKSISAGVPFPGCGAHIVNPGEDGIGEICLSGENLMLGYFKRDDLTAESVVDGSFRTGDLGYIDKDGYIVITGRKKNVIITKNGKNVFPEELEYQLCLNETVAEAMCFEQDAQSKDDTSIAASIYPDWDLLKQQLGEDAKDDEKVKEYLWTLVNKMNEENPPYKMIRRILLRHQPLEKNTSNKVVRFRPGNKEEN